jgi:hypothetical protein
MTTTIGSQIVTPYPADCIKFEDIPNRYALILLMLQDSHVSTQREQYELHKAIYKEPTDNGFLYPTEDRTLNTGWFYYLLLKKRFPEEENRFTNNERLHFDAIQAWLKKCVPVCPVCNWYSITQSCRPENMNLPPIFLRFYLAPDTTNENGEIEEVVTAYLQSSLFPIDADIVRTHT